jgi:hypothetical protein
MSTDIKPGQVWAWNDGRTSPGPEITVTSLGEYQGGDARVNYSYTDDLDVFDVDLASFREKAHLIKDVVTTPAPLDPSKVKAGDTVTLTHGWAKVEDKVTEVADWRPNGGTVGMTLAHRPDAPFYLNAWALTAHQPAPKKTPREQVVDILIDYSNNRADDYDTADRIIAALVPAATPAAPSRGQFDDMERALQDVGKFVEEIDTDIVHDGSYAEILRAEFGALCRRLEQAEADKDVWINRHNARVAWAVREKEELTAGIEKVARERDEALARPRPTRDDLYEAVAHGGGWGDPGNVDAVNHAVDAVEALLRGESR